MSEIRNWVHKTVVCPDCGTTVKFYVDYTSRGWMDEGGYWASGSASKDHVVMQPTRLDERTGMEQLRCERVKAEG